MKTLVALILGLTLSVSESIRPVPYSRSNFRAGTTAFNDGPSPSFYKVPSSLFDSRSDHFKLVEIDDCRPVSWHCMPQDVSYCLGFDRAGNIAAIQIGYLKEYADKVDPCLYDFSTNTNFKEKVLFNRTIYAVEIWLTNPETLTEKGRYGVDEIIEGLWANVNGKWLRFDHRFQKVGPSIGDFDLQGCLPQKGTLYVYNFNKYSTCHDAFYLFLVYDQESLVGFGHAVPGYFPQGPTRNWFDYPHGEKLAQIAPSPPSCFSEVLEYGFTSSITFLIDEPWNIRCPVCAC